MRTQNSAATVLSLMMSPTRIVKRQLFRAKGAAVTRGSSWRVVAANAMPLFFTTSSKESRYAPSPLHAEYTGGAFQERGYSPATYRRIGERVVAWAAERRLMNNDSLAHVRQLAERGGELDAQLESSMYADFVTDMGERSPDLCHYHRLGMHIEAGDIVSESGLRMRESIERSIQATCIDVDIDQRRLYGLQREEAQLAHIDIALKWVQSSLPGKRLGFASLCPPQSEVSYEVARANSFKPDRMLASLWIYEHNGTNGLTMHALSLEHCTLNRFQRLLNACQVNHSVSSTTMDQLERAIDFCDATPDDIRLMWATILAEDGLAAADHTVENKVVSQPEAFTLYTSFVLEVEASLRCQKPTKSLQGMLLGMGVEQFVDMARRRTFCVGDAENVMEFVRSRMIPHYLYDADTHRSSTSRSEEVLAASVQAAKRTESYDSSCPSSVTHSTSEQVTQTGTGAMDRFVTMELLSSQKRKGNCLACKVEATTVYGCGFCHGCHSVWGRAYLKNGQMLSIKEVAKRAGTKEKKRTIAAKKFRLFSLW